MLVQNPRREKHRGTQTLGERKVRKSESEEASEIEREMFVSVELMEKSWELMNVLLKKQQNILGSQL